jgi:hypothetical protein
MSTACNVQPKKSKSVFERPPLETVYHDRAFRTAHGSAGSVVTAAQVWGYEKAVAAKNELSFLIGQETIAPVTAQDMWLKASAMAPNAFMRPFDDLN